MRMPTTLSDILGPERIIGIDVGARGGIPEHWARHRDHFLVHAFEPDAAACEEARRTAPSGVQFHPYALGAKDGPAKLYVTRRPSASSLYEPNLDFARRHHGTADVEVDRVVTVDLVSLDTFAKRERLGRVDVLKLDVQGAELDVLRGGRRLLAESLAVETEVEFAPLYKGQPLFPDVHRHLTEQGFELYDLRTHRVYHAKDGVRDFYLRKHFRVAEGSVRLSARLVAGDGLYFRPSQSQGDLAAARRFIAILCVYGYYDVALAQVEELAESGLLDASEAGRIASRIVRLFPGPRLSESTSLAGRALRWLGYRTGRLPKRVFWTRRRTPDQ